MTKAKWSTNGLVVGVCAALLVGLSATSTPSRATDPPPAAEGDLQKMQEALPDAAPAKPQKARKVLVYGNCNGFVHSSTTLGERTIAALGKKTGAWSAVINNDPSAFDDLKEYDAVMLVNTTGNFMLPGRGEAGFGRRGGAAPTDEQRQAAEAKLKPYRDNEKKRMQNLVDFVQKDGKGLAGIHAAADTSFREGDYRELIGAIFNRHPWTANEKVFVKIDDPKSPLTPMFDKEGFSIVDEIYQFSHTNKPTQTYSRDKLHVLLSLDMAEGKTQRKGNDPDNDYGVAWIKQDGKGRVFYCSLGHNEHIYYNPAVVKFYLAGLQYALGDLEADATPSGKVSSAGAK